MEFDGSVCRLQCSVLGLKHKLSGHETVSRLVKTFNTSERCHHRKMWAAVVINAFLGMDRLPNPPRRRCLMPFVGMFPADVVTPEVALAVASRANLWRLVV